MLLDDKTVGVISILINNESVRVDEISEISKMSKRNVYYIISDLNDLLESNKLERLKSGHGKGFSLDNKQKSFLEKMYTSSNLNIQQTLSAEERVAIIYCKILFSKDRILSKHLEDMMGYSKFTISNDISTLKNELERFDIKLLSTKENGYHVVGQQLNKRRAYFYFFSYIYGIFNNDFNAVEIIVESVDRVKSIYQSFGEFEAFSNAKYFESSLMAMSILISQIELGDNPNIFEEKLLTEPFEYELTNEYSFIKDNFDLVTEEHEYFTLYLVASRINPSVNISNEHLHLSSSIVEMFNALTGLSVGNKNFEYKLAKHLAIAKMRYKYEIVIDNPLVIGIKDQYEEIFNTLRQTSILLEDSLGGVLTENEIGFLTLYFAGYLLDNEHDIYKIRVLVICLNGASTSYLLTRELVKMDSRIEVINFAGITDLETYENLYDLVVTTIDLESISKPFVKVNPILTLEDRSNIINMISKVLLTKKQECNSNNEQDLKVSVTMKDTIHEKLNEDSLGIEGEVYRVDDVMRKDFVGYLDPSGMTWMEVLEHSCEPMLKAGYIDESFLPQLIENINDYGPYMIYSNKYLLGHAKLENSIKLGLSITMLTSPIEIYGEVVEKIVMISYTDYHNHLYILDNLYKLFQNQSFDNYIKNLSDRRMLYDILIQNIFK